MATKLDRNYIDELLKAHLPVTHNKVGQAMEYSLFTGGKRIRPLLLLLTAQSVGGKVSNNAKLLATALEYIHTYSLIHDDLPCMDNDDMRRGRRSCHMQFGEATAVLAGDALLNLACETVLGGSFDKNYRQACKSLLGYAGIGGMILGQSLDLFTETHGIDDANQVALHKTGDLIRAAFVCGALCGGASDEEVQTFDKIGASFGIAYQVVDDMLDKEKCERSFLDILDESDSIDYVKSLTDEINRLCDSLPYDLSFIREFARKNSERKF